MADFRFPCPECGQEILCDASCSGTQIDCPACNQSVVVPLSAIPPEHLARIIKNLSMLGKAILFAGLGILFFLGIVGWSIFTPNKTIQTIQNNWTMLDGKDEQWNFSHNKIFGHTVDGDSILASDNEFANVNFSARVSSTNREASLAFRMQDSANGYIVVYAPRTKQLPNGYIALNKRVNNNETNLATYHRRTFAGGQPENITVIARGASIDVQLDGKKIIHADDSTFDSGHIGFRIYGWGDFPCDGVFSKIKIQ